MEIHTILFISNDEKLTSVYSDYLDNADDLSLVLIHATSENSITKSLQDFFCRSILLDVDNTSITITDLHRILNIDTLPKKPSIISLITKRDNMIISEQLAAGATEILIKEEINQDLLIKTIKFTIEKQLLQNYIQYQQLLITTLADTIPNPIYYKDMYGKYTRCNKSFAEMINKPYDQIIGKTDDELFNDEIADHLKQYDTDLLEQEHSITYECSCTLKEGKTKNVLINKASLKNENNLISGTVGVISEITQQKEIELALRKSEERNREILESIPDLMFKINREGNYLDDSLKSKIVKVFPDSIIKQSMPYIETAFNSDLIQIFEYPVYIEGNLEYYEARYIISGPDELLVILRNITKRIEVQEQLKKARDDAEAANRAKSEFLANMSHEIRTPLNGLLGFIEILKKTDLNKTQMEYFDIISESAISLQGIINDILDFSKIESGKLTIDKIEFDPFSEFESSIDLFTVRAQEKEITVLSFIDPTLPSKIIGDPLRIKQVFTNLLSNAIKFTQVGGLIILTIKVVKKTNNNCTVRFSVEDNGIGIDEVKQKVIFEAFSQADTSITRNYGGTGLGLSISSNLIKLMGGSLQLKSQKGKGSTFLFYLDFESPDVNTTLQSLVHCNNYRPHIVLFSNSKKNHPLNHLLHDYFSAFTCRTTVCTALNEIKDLQQIDVLVISTGKMAPELEKFLLSNTIPVISVSNTMVPDNSDNKPQWLAKTLTLPINAKKILGTLSELFPDSLQVDNDYLTKKYDTEELPQFNASILVAEDNMINQNLISLMLKNFGIETTIAGNGMSAIDKYREQKFDLIFMDIQMPVYDGFEATRIIREELTDIPIIALTAKMISEDKELFSEAGFNDYLLKPINFHNLHKTLLKYLSHKKTPITKTVTNARTGLIQSNSPQYDTFTIAKKLGISRQSLISIITDFFNVIDPLLQELENSINDYDYDRINRISHKIKGSAYNLKIDEPADILQTLEDKSENRDDYNYMKDLMQCKQLFSHYKELIFNDSDIQNESMIK